ncbi:hypothetical protein [Escherichia coli]|uniref:hypothetical protein n=1 Tax=Escherichia coli TaxID=562 RepID=UPI0012FFBFEC|nr:hypothetical protein [Escherichia coli]MBC0539901.1 hypothetical protein [Escherichia coli]
MINFKPKIPAMLGALAVLTAGAAHAELLEYTFYANVKRVADSFPPTVLWRIQPA